jgi:hypothetical protein
MRRSQIGGSVPCGRSENSETALDPALEYSAFRTVAVIAPTFDEMQEGAPESALARANGFGLALFRFEAEHSDHVAHESVAGVGKVRGLLEHFEQSRIHFANPRNMHGKRLGVEIGARDEFGGKPRDLSRIRPVA